MPSLDAARAALIAAIALVALCLAWELLLVPIGRGTLALKALPLMACLPGLWRRRFATFQATALVVWLYVTEGLVRVVSDGSGLSRALAGAELLLCAALFAACVFHIRSCRAASAAAPRSAP